MPKVFSNDYFTVVAETKEDVIQFFLNENLTEEVDLGEIREVDPDKKTILFPVDGLPTKYHDEEKYPRENWYGQYTGVRITLTEAMKYRKEETLPYIICVSSDVV